MTTQDVVEFELMKLSEDVVKVSVNINIDPGKQWESHRYPIK